MRVSEPIRSLRRTAAYSVIIYFRFSGPSSGTVRPRRRANAARAHEVSRHFRESALVDFEARGQARPAPGSSRGVVSVSCIIRTVRRGATPMWRRRARDSAGCALERAPHDRMCIFTFENLRSAVPDEATGASIGCGPCRCPPAVCGCRGRARGRRERTTFIPKYHARCRCFFRIRTQYAPTPPARDPIPAARRVGVCRALIAAAP